MMALEEKSPVHPEGDMTVCTKFNDDTSNTSFSVKVH